MQEQKHVVEILELLKQNYPHAKMILNYSNNWELLVTVMLSAQCTDIMVNKVTPKLFVMYKTIPEYANADTKELETLIRSTGFYHNKAKNIKAAAKIVCEKFGERIPKTITELITMPGVARKTANVVLGNAYGIYEGIAVDTHVNRLANRLGLSSQKNPDKIEQDLMWQFDKKNWFALTYVLIEHGRQICVAKKPKCDECFLQKFCPSAFKFPQFQKTENR